MENTLRRNRNLRSNYSRRKMPSEVDKKFGKIIKQVLISITIFSILLTIKNIDSTFTKYITSKTQFFLSDDLEVSKIYDSMKRVSSKLNISNEKIRSVFNGYGLKPKISLDDSSKIPEDMKAKIFDYKLLSEIQFVIPTKGIMSSGFGTRMNPINNIEEFHNAVDISAPEGTEIKSTIDGVIQKVGVSDSLGNYVQVKHADDLMSLYAHASSLDVKEGQFVNSGDVIARVGTTGWSNGPHVHFELWKGDQMVNVEKLLKFDANEVTSF